MLEGQDIVCVAPSFWRNEAPLNVHHVMGRLAGGNRILYIESLGLRPPGGSRGDWRKVVARLRNWRRGLEQTPEGIWVLAPLILPLHARAWARRINRWLLRRRVKRAMERLGMTRPLLWIFLPTGAGLVGALGEKLVIYHCVDAYAENPGVDREAILSLEGEILERCDLVFATSRSLHEEKRPSRGHSHYFPNVADVPHFAAERQLPEELAPLGRPLLGYVGNVAGYKLDLALLIALARARADWQFVLVGPLGAGDPGTDISAIAELANVHLLGPRPYDELPAYVAAFDVCLIPFKLNASTRASFPLKFYEYMAAGKEIVATPLPALAEYRHRPELCRFASDAGAFAAAVQASLQRQQSEALRALRLAEARRHSWNQRMADIENAVAEALALRGEETP